MKPKNCQGIEKQLAKQSLKPVLEEKVKLLIISASLFLALLYVFFKDASSQAKQKIVKIVKVPTLVVISQTFFPLAPKRQNFKDIKKFFVVVFNFNCQRRGRLDLKNDKTGKVGNMKS